MNDSPPERPRLHTNSQTLSLSFESSLIQSCMRLDAPEELVLDYTRSMMGALLFVPHPASVLMIGLGGGSMLKYLHRHVPEADLTAVEINQGVIDMRQDFHIPPDSARLRIVCADGAKFIRQAPHRYDLILVDGFTGEGLPEALCSNAFFKHARAALTEQGMVVANVQADTQQTKNVLARIGKVFPGGMISVESDEGGNEIVFAAAEPVLSQAMTGFDAIWENLAAHHQATLAVASTRIQGALTRRHRSLPANRR